MPPTKRLEAKDLYRKCDLEALDFDTTEALEDLKEILGQPRAVAAVEFGVGIERDGYNIFAFGPPGTGKHSAVREHLESRAAGEPVPPDCCYVNNFEHDHLPRLLLLPPGQGTELRSGMDRLVGELGTVLTAAFESEEYQSRSQVIQGELEDRQSKVISDLSQEALEKGLALLRTPAGIVFAPRRGEDVLSQEDFQKLPDEEQLRLKEQIEVFEQELKKVFRQVPGWQRETRERLRELNREVSQAAVKPLLDELRQGFEETRAVQDYLDQVEADIVDKATSFVTRSEDQFQQALKALVEGHALLQPIVRRYRVNVLVNRVTDQGAPVVYEDNPTFQNLVGRIEHLPQMGGLVTDFNLIKPGALHRANGGYLLLDAMKLLTNAQAWAGLKRTLRSRQIKTESLGQALSLVSTYSLEPEPVPLSVKVVLLGSPRLYYLLSTADPDFRELFKVAADFSEGLERSSEAELLYARHVAKLIRNEGLRPFDRSAVCRVIEQGARAIGDSLRLSLFVDRVRDLLREADHWGAQAGEPVITADHVQRAIDSQVYRFDRIRERLLEETLRGRIFVDTDGDETGQVNGLTVLALGDFTFGRPSRITARVRLGKGEVINIEREVELSGPIHSKGVLILVGFLGARYAAERPLSLSASLVFEQSYGGVEGDSASSAELYALLSAIADLPLRQSLAVTGSVNQRGRIQPVGGVNDKIEGFFDLCRERGLSGSQGVLIPAANVESLMLRSDVVAAVAQGQFHIYPVSTVDEGISLLTGVEAGERDSDGRYPEGSVNRRVEDRLVALAEAARAFSGPPPSDRRQPKSSESGDAP